MKGLRMVHSEKWLRDNWDRLIVQPHDDYHVNLECDLDWQMLPIAGMLTEEQREMVRKAYAPKIAKVAEGKLTKMREMLERLDNGESSLGYITWSQEWSARSEPQDRYEFNVFQLKAFKEKYGIGGN